MRLFINNYCIVRPKNFLPKYITCQRQALWISFLLWKPFSISNQISFWYLIKLCSYNTTKIQTSKVLRVESDGKVEPFKLENSSNTLFGKSKNISQQEVFKKQENLSQPDIVWKQVKLCRHWGLNSHKSSLVQTPYLSFWRSYYCLIYQSNAARSAKYQCLNKKQLTQR